MLTTVVLFLAVGLASAREFNTPIMNKPVKAAGITKYEDTYYLVDEFELAFNGSLPILISKDLQNWESRLIYLYVDDFDTMTDFYEPELHVVNGQFRLYFRKYHQGYDETHAAYASDILGPYYMVQEPLNDFIGTTYHPTIMESNGVNYFIWNSGYDPEIMYAQRLNPDGLSVADEPLMELFKADLEWEQGAVLSPTAIKKGDYYYIFYSVLMDCRKIYGIGVARSLYALGPYEKSPEPLIVSDNKIVVPKYPTVVLDVDNKSYVLLYAGHKASEVCAPANPDYLCAKSLAFDKNGWPYITK